MAMEPRTQGIGAVRPTGEAQQQAQPRPTVDGAAFRALLERMEAGARDLDRASEEVQDPVALGAAVANARATVEEALSAGGDLLEAVRAMSARATAESESTNTRTDPDRDGSGTSR